MGTEYMLVDQELTEGFDLGKMWDQRVPPPTGPADVDRFVREACLYLNDPDPYDVEVLGQDPTPPTQEDVDRVAVPLRAWLNRGPTWPARLVVISEHDEDVYYATHETGGLGPETACAPCGWVPCRRMSRAS